MGNYIVLPKITDQRLLAKYYSAADAFVICSKQENFPTTCVEAQCCGTRVFGFDVGGVKETSVLASEDFVEYGDLDSLAERIKNAQKISNLADQAAHRYAKKNMIDQYLNEYDVGGKKKRILQIDVVCKELSTGKIAYDLYQGIVNDGRRAAICYGRGKIQNSKDLHKIAYDFETYLHAGLARITGYNGCFSPLSTNNLIRQIEKFNPDLIHIHELHGYYVNIEKLISYIKRRNIQVVWTFHCEYMYTGKCGYAYDCDRFLNGCGHCPFIADYPKSLFFDKTRQMLKKKIDLLEDMDLRIIAPSKWLAERIKRTYLKVKPISVIHNGIDTDVFHPYEECSLRSQLGLPADKKIILSVASGIMSDRKGGDFVIELARKMRDEDAYFVLIGD